MGGPKNAPIRAGRTGAGLCAAFRTAGEEAGAAASSRPARPAEAAAQRQRNRRKSGSIHAPCVVGNGRRRRKGGHRGSGTSGFCRVRGAAPEKGGAPLTASVFPQKLQSVAERWGERPKQGKALSRSPPARPEPVEMSHLSRPAKKRAEEADRFPFMRGAVAASRPRMTRPPAVPRRGMPRHEKEEPDGFGRAVSEGRAPASMAGRRNVPPSAGLSRHDRHAERFSASAKRRSSRSMDARGRKNAAHRRPGSSFSAEQGEAFAGHSVVRKRHGRRALRSVGRGGRGPRARTETARHERARLWWRQTATGAQKRTFSPGPEDRRNRNSAMRGPGPAGVFPAAGRRGPQFSEAWRFSQRRMSFIFLRRTRCMLLHTRGASLLMPHFLR